MIYNPGKKKEIYKYIFVVPCESILTILKFKLISNYNRQLCVIFLMGCFYKYTHVVIELILMTHTRISPRSQFVRECNFLNVKMICFLTCCQHIYSLPFFMILWFQINLTPKTDCHFLKYIDKGIDFINIAG